MTNYRSKQITWAELSQVISQMSDEERSLPVTVTTGSGPIKKANRLVEIPRAEKDGTPLPSVIYLGG